MQTAFKDEETVHLGYNVKRIREIIGIKQMELGAKCNGGWSQQQISKLENLEVIDEPTLEVLAKGLGVTTEFIKRFKEERAVYNIQNNNTFNDNSSTQHYRPTINNDTADKLYLLIEKLTNAVAGLSEKVEKLKGK